MLRFDGEIPLTRAEWAQVAREVVDRILDGGGGVKHATGGYASGRPCRRTSARTALNITRITSSGRQGSISPTGKAV